STSEGSSKFCGNCLGFVADAALERRHGFAEYKARGPAVKEDHRTARDQELLTRERTPSYNSGDLLGGERGVLVLPETQHAPPGPGDPGVGTPIAAHVRADLAPPPRRVGFGPSTVNRASVPEAAVHEDG